MEKFTKADLEAASEIIEDARRLLGVEDFKMILSHSDSPEEEEESAATEASNQVAVRYKESIITLYPQYLELSEEARVETLFHEVAHILTQPLMDLISDLLNGKLVTTREVVNVNEQIVTLISRIPLRIEKYYEQE